MSATWCSWYILMHCMCCSRTICELLVSRILQWEIPSFDDILCFQFCVLHQCRFCIWCLQFFFCINMTQDRSIPTLLLLAIHPDLQIHHAVKCPWPVSVSVSVTHWQTCPSHPLAKHASDRSRVDYLPCIRWDLEQTSLCSSELDSFRATAAHTIETPQSAEIWNNRESDEIWNNRDLRWAWLYGIKSKQVVIVGCWWLGGWWLGLQEHGVLICIALWWCWRAISMENWFA